MLLEDLLVIDEATIYPRFTRGGSLHALDIIDGATKNILTTVRPNGDTVRFNPTTDEFGILGRDGVIRTYYRTDPSEHGYPTNLDYFDAQ
jgi:pyocin large subunit-like protein